MKTIEEHIDFINSKLQVLLKKYASLQKENASLRSEVEHYKEKQLQSLQKIDSLETQANILKTSAGSMNEDEKKNFEKKINQYIKDVDKCITMLNN
jgi:uncharacterized coiled-coil DUF342 family protein